MFERITFDKDIMGGRACIRGMRIPVSLIVNQLAHGATTEEILSSYPDLEHDDVEQALQYAARLTEAGAPAKDWRLAAGMFTASEFSREVDEEALKIRQADREAARVEFGE